MIASACCVLGASSALAQSISSSSTELSSASELTGSRGPDILDLAHAPNAGAAPARARQAARKPVPARRPVPARKKAKRPVTVPIELGVGPALFTLGNPFGASTTPPSLLVDDQLFHYGLHIDIAAVITYEFVKKNPMAVPRKYRKMFTPGKEVLFTPGILGLVPRDIMISPKMDQTGVYGATWEFLRIGISPIQAGSTKLSMGAGLVATYAYIDSDLFESATHFLRPGISAGLSLGTMFTDSFGMTIGWDSNFYIPQALGGEVFDMGDSDTNLWHIGELYLKLRFRFPYSTTL